jgi:hypothetical protein
VTIIPDLIKPLSEASLKSFDQIVSKWIIRDSDNKTGLNKNTGSNEKSNPAFGVTETEILALKEKVTFAENNFLTNLLIYIIFRLIVT